MRYDIVQVPTCPKYLLYSVLRGILYFNSRPRTIAYNIITIYAIVCSVLGYNRYRKKKNIQTQTIVVITQLVHAVYVQMIHNIISMKGFLL